VKEKIDLNTDKAGEEDNSGEAVEGDTSGNW
jgi:hypothetical protein